MRVAGIIAEYNPMHNGHIYHLERSGEISKADFVVAVISGNFTQRGEPAMLDKWIRSRIAVDNGVDLVLEIPFVFATGSAEMFARGGVGILEGLGLVDTLCFGSETADTGELQFMAEFLKNESPEFKMFLKKHLDMGISFPKARELAVNECLGMDAGRLLKNPNDILAIEYLKHIRSMTPIAIKREGDHSSEKMPGSPECKDGEYIEGERSGQGENDAPGSDGCHPSAMAIRKAVIDGRLESIRGYVPGDVYEELSRIHDKYSAEDPDEKYHCENYPSENDLSGNGSYGIINQGSKYYDLLRGRILSLEAGELADVEGVTEGIENRIKKEIRIHGDIEGFADSLKSKRFTRTAINRMLVRILTGLKKTVPKELYTRVLAFNENGSMLIKEASKNGGIKVITNINKYEEVPESLEYDIRATDLYNLMNGLDLYENSEYVMKPYIGK